MLLPRTGTQRVKPVTDRFTFEMPNPTYPGPKSTCLANGMKCSDMCKLTTCQKQPNDEEDEDVGLASDDGVDEYVY